MDFIKQRIDLSIKSYKEIRSEMLTKCWGQRMSMADVEEKAAKEYAKQWIDVAAEISDKGALGMQHADILELKNRIDAYE